MKERYKRLAMNRVIITVLLILVQLVWIVFALVKLTEFVSWITTVFTILSILVVLYIIGKDDNSAYNNADIQEGSRTLFCGVFLNRRLL